MLTASTVFGGRQSVRRCVIEILRWQKHDFLFSKDRAFWNGIEYDSRRNCARLIVDLRTKLSLYKRTQKRHNKFRGTHNVYMLSEVINSLSATPECTLAARPHDVSVSVYSCPSKLGGFCLSFFMQRYAWTSHECNVLSCGITFLWQVVSFRQFLFRCIPSLLQNGEFLLFNLAVNDKH